MSTPTKRRVGIGLLCAVLLFVWWYIEAEDFSESRVSGQYVLVHDGITQHLTLKRDHTFEQEDTDGGIIKRTNGTWRVFSSTGHMAFSKDFLDAPAAWQGQDEHEVYGIFKNYFGIVSLTFASGPTPVTTYKKLFN